MNLALSNKQDKVLDLCYQEMGSIFRFQTSPEEHIKHQPVKEHYDSMISRLNENLNDISSPNYVKSDTFLNKFQTLTENLIKLHDLGEILGEPATFLDFIRVPLFLREEFNEKVSEIEKSVVKLVFAKAFNLLNETNHTSKPEQINIEFKKIINNLRQDFATIQTTREPLSEIDDEKWAENKIQRMNVSTDLLNNMIKLEEAKIKSQQLGEVSFKEYEDLINFFSWLDSFPGNKVLDTASTLRENNIYKNIGFQEKSKLASFDVARAFTHFIDKFDGSSYAINKYTSVFFDDIKKKYSDNPSGISDDLKKHVSRFTKPFQYFLETLGKSMMNLDEKQKELLNKLKTNLTNQVQELERIYKEKFETILKN